MSTHIAADRWRKIIQQHQRSGLTVVGFCRRARVPQSSFFAWRRKLRAEVTFAEVKVSGETRVETGAIELRFPDRRCIVVRPGFDRTTLLELLAALESASGPATSEGMR